MLSQRKYVLRIVFCKHYPTGLGLCAGLYSRVKNSFGDDEGCSSVNPFFLFLAIGAPVRTKGAVISVNGSTAHRHRMKTEYYYRTEILHREWVLPLSSPRGAHGPGALLQHRSDFNLMLVFLFSLFFSPHAVRKQRWRCIAATARDASRRSV